MLTLFGVKAKLIMLMLAAVPKACGEQLRKQMAKTQNAQRNGCTGFGLFVALIIMGYFRRFEWRKSSKLNDAALQVIPRAPQYGFSPEMGLPRADAQPLGAAAPT
jgi:uncharacterized membrane protein